MHGRMKVEGDRNAAIRPLVIDSFAGGGGTSLGLTWAGFAPDIAINHDAAAIAMHEANHPECHHVREDVWKTDLLKLVGGRDVRLVWLSPDCTHFSRSKGGKPVKQEIRSLAWVACRWADKVRPDVMILENVREFESWGPLLPQWVCRECSWKGTEGQAVLVRTKRKCPRCESRRLSVTLDLVPDPLRKGLTFRRWIGRLRNLGYQVQWKNLNAADYGAPTHRRRLFVVARCDGLPIVWPEATHGDPKRLHLTPLFPKLKPWRTAAEIIDWDLPCPSIFDRKKPLAENTLRRIALGIKRYVLTAAEPFVVPVTHQGQRRCPPLSEPLPTITSARRGELALCAATLAQVGYGERNGQAARVPGLTKPLGTVVAGGAKHALVAAFLSKYHTQKAGEHRCLNLDQPINTLDTQNRFGLVAACLARFNHGEKQWNSVNQPLGTVTSQGNKFGLVFAFLVKYLRTCVGQSLLNPLHTQTATDRFGLVAVELAPGEYGPAVAVDLGERGVFVIADIGLRMLAPRELARAQGFPDSYLLSGPGGAKLSKEKQVARIGNSVCPAMAKALAEANCVEADALAGASGL